MSWFGAGALRQTITEGVSRSISQRLGLAVLLATGLASATAATGQLTTSAAADPTYGVQHAEGGIYWRSGPDWNTPEAVAGNGFYPNTIISVHCYQSGAGDVPGSTDSMWEQATDVGGSGTGSGWVNEHFIADNQPINQPSPGVPPCNAPAPTPPAPTPTPTPPPTTSSGLVFPVFNAEGGIYYRYGPHWSETTSTLGVGVYNDDHVELICGAYGDAVGPYNDTAWSYVRNLTRPSIGDGWVSEHFINDGAATDQFVPGEGICPSTIPGAGSAGGGGGSLGSGPMIELLPGGGSAYFAPDDGNHPGAPSPATLTLPYKQWTSTNCGTNHAVVPASWNSKRITTLAGFSKGRLGPIYFLRANRSQWSDINYILLFDPADKSEYEDTCDKRYPQSQLLAEWLTSSTNNHLAIIAGKVTADAANPDHGHGHAGIQDTLFPKIRGRAIASQVVVCNYDLMEHWDVFKNFATYMNKSPITTSTCPQHAFGWHP
jgi:hypothetical protein